MADRNRTLKSNKSDEGLSVRRHQEITGKILSLPETYLKSLPHEFMNVERISHALAEILNDVQSMQSDFENVVRDNYEEYSQNLNTITEYAVQQLLAHTNRTIDAMSTQAKWSQIMSGHMFALARK